jgi:hypothetical protein
MKNCLAIILVLFTAMSVNAQSVKETSEVIAENLFVNGEFSFGFDHSGMHTRSYSHQVGYKVTRNFYPLIHVGTMIGLYHRGEEKDYFNTANIGAGVGFSIIPQLDVHALYNTSMGNRGWKYNTYEVGLTLKGKTRSSETYGFGYRYVNSRTEGVDDYKGLFVSIGFRL